LPLTDTKKIYLLFEDDQDFSQTLEQVGIHTSQQLSLMELRQKNGRDIQSFVMPFGMPVSWVSAKHEDQVGFYRSVQRLIPSGGCLLVGFNNSWNLRSTPQKKSYPATPRRIANQLMQAGFTSVTIFGAMPNLAIPEYIFDLDSRTMQFALQNRFRRKQAILRVLRILSAAIGWRRLSNFLPCYFAVARLEL
jgi:hypothetical protein